MEHRVVCRYGAILAALCGLFAVRVVGQLIQHWAPQPFLPDFESFQGSNIGYQTLLLSQLVILTVMSISTAKVVFGRMRPSAIVARWLLFLGGIYLAGSLYRIVIGLGGENAAPWFRAWIPAFFHVVLALFILTLGHYHQVGRRR